MGRLSQIPPTESGFVFSAGCGEWRSGTKPDDTSTPRTG